MFAIRNTAARTEIVGLSNGGSLILAPGLNPKVSDSAWKEAKATKGVKLKLAAGVLVEEAHDGAGDAAILNLSGKSPAEAVRLIKATNTPDTLTEWLAAETRPAIKAMIAARLEELPTLTLKSAGAKEAAPLRPDRAPVSAADATQAELLRAMTGGGTPIGMGDVEVPGVS